MKQPEPLNLRDYGEILRRRRRQVLIPAVILAVVAASLSLGAGLRTEPLYTSQLQVLVTSSSSDGGTAPTSTGAHAELMHSFPVAERVAGQLGLADDTDTVLSLLERTEVTLDADSAVLTIRASDSSPELARTLPDAFVDRYEAYYGDVVLERSDTRLQGIEAQVEDLRRQLEETTTELVEVETQIAMQVEREVEADRLAALEAIRAGDDPSLDTIEDLLILLLMRADGTGVVAPELTRRQQLLERQSGEVQDRLLEYQRERIDAEQSAEGALDTTVVAPVRTSSEVRIAEQLTSAARDAVLGLLLGLALGVALALLREWQRRPLVRERDAEEALDLRVLAGVTHGNDLSRDVAGSPGPRREEYRRLRAVVGARLPVAAAAQASSDGASRLALLVTDPANRTSSADVALELATAYADGRTRVLLIELPGTDRRTSNRLRTSEPSTRRLDLLAGPAGLADAAVALPVEGLRFLPAGVDTQDGERSLRRTIAELLREADSDVIVIDAPPMNETSDADDLGQLVDGVLLTARWAHTSLPDLDDAVTRLRGAAVPVLGLVVVHD